MRSHWRLLAAVAGAACSGETPENTPPEPIPGFVLTVEPTTLADQDPFDGNPDVSLVVDDGKGADVYFLGSANDSLSLPQLPHLVKGTVVGVLAERPGGKDDEWDPDLTVAYGQVILNEDVPIDGSSVAVEVLVTSFADLALLDTQVDSQIRIHAATAMAPGGAVYLFGGTDPSKVASAGTASSRTIFKLDGTDTGNTEFQKLNVTMPTSPFLTQTGNIDSDQVTGAIAALIQDDDGPRILVAGGRNDYDLADGNTKAAYLFDPTVDDWVKSGNEPLRINMPVEMGWHSVLPLSNGDLLLYGGIQGNGLVSPDMFLYDTSRRQFSTVSLSNEIGEWQPSAGSLESMGAMVCGGATLSPSAVQNTEPWLASDYCVIIGLDGSVTDVARLPVPLAHTEMIGLGNGMVLLTGGMEDSLDPVFGRAAPSASRNAYIYDSGANAWSAAGTMREARAEHRMLLLPDGDVLIIGGVGGVKALYGDTQAAVSCAERYDADAKSFIALDACSGAGAGMEPTLTHHPGDGGFVLAGNSQVGGNFIGTGAYGLIGTGLE